MPQLDIYAFNIQCFWLTIIFFLSFYFFYNFILIQLLKIFRIRIFINMYINQVRNNIKLIFINYNFNLFNYNNIIFNLLLNQFNWFKFWLSYKKKIQWLYL